ncbi:Acyl carrier protein [Buchnera aphidicola (Takecallis arundicolens)]|uniref:acyl carrier protein n=1 Tax=Buchnera aphidicola TaxID=9 RepID=UPI003464768E
MKKIKYEIKKIISNIMNIKIEKINEKTNLFEELKVDSLDMIEITMAIEEKFEIEIPDSDLENLYTIDLIVQYLQKNK